MSRNVEFLALYNPLIVSIFKRSMDGKYRWNVSYLRPDGKIDLIGDTCSSFKQAKCKAVEIALGGLERFQKEFKRNIGKEV